MQINLHVTFTDKTEVEVVAVAADIVAFENHFDMSVAKLEKEVRLTHLLFIAYSQQRRTKATDLDFEKWVENVAEIKELTPKK